MSDKTWVMPALCVVCGEMLCEELAWLHSEFMHTRRLKDFRVGGARHWRVTQQGIAAGLMGPVDETELG